MNKPPYLHYFSGLFTGFILCSLQFYELSHLSYEAKRIEKGVIVPDQLSSIFLNLRIEEAHLRRDNSEKYLWETKVWSESLDTIKLFSERLEHENNFHQNIRNKIGSILLRNSLISLLIILTALSLPWLMKKYKEKTIKS